MFWRRKSEPKQSETAPGTPSASAAGELEPVVAEEVLDWLAETVRIYGEHAFDVADVSGEQTRLHCEIWARHLLLGVKPPRPQSRQADDDPDERPECAGEREEDEPEGGPRDWPGLRRYLSSHRSGESDYVRQSQSNLREAIWAFISGIRRSVLHDQQSDDQVNHRIHRLEGALARDDHEAIKWEAQETIGLLSQLMSQRQEQHQTEMAQLASRLERMRGQLDAVREEAATDPLTRLYNRAAFDEQLQRALDFSSLFDKPSYLVMLDIDHFKWVNDNHGHPTGDEVLRQVAANLTRSFLRRDDFVARYGGEEFAVLLRGGDLAAAAMLAERGLMSIRDMEIDYQGASVRVTASAGLAQLQPGDTAENWVGRADRALYAAKDGGRDQLVVDSHGPPAAEHEEAGQE